MPASGLSTRVSLLFLLSIVRFSCDAQLSSSPSIAGAESALERARAAYDKGDDQAATSQFLIVLSNTPSSFEANETLGLIYAGQGAYGKALPYLESGVRLAPAQAAAHANLGTALLKLGRSKGAVLELARACTLQPADAQAHANLAHAQMAEAAPAEAAKSFATAAALAIPSADLLYDWALALYDAGQPAQATEVLTQIPAGQVNDQSESLLGDAEEKQGHYEAAAAHLQRAAHLVSSEPNIYALVVELLRHWSWDQAREICRSGLERYPGSERLAMAQGVALYGSAKYPEAASAFSALLAAHPGSALYADLLGRSCELLDESSSGSCDQLERFAATHPGNAQINIYAARSILHRSQDHQDPAKARELLHAAIAADPNASDAYYQLSVLEQQGRNWPESAALLEKAIALRPGFAEAHYRLARAYYHAGDKARGDEQIALQQRYQKEQKQELDRKLREVTIFLFQQP